jgi:hypothetical protein
LTYSVDGVPAGVLTGYETARGGIYVEHVIAWRPRVLRPLLRRGLAMAWERGASHVVFHLPREWDRAKPLMRLGAELGFQKYQEDSAYDYWVLWK